MRTIMKEKKNNFDLISIKKRNEILKNQENEIFEDFKNNLISYRELANKYSLTLYDIVKLFNQKKFKNEIEAINEARAINYVDQIDDDIDEIKDDSSNSFVAKQRLKVENKKWLAKCTAPKLFNENYQVALIKQESDQQAVVPKLEIILNNNK